MSLAEHSIEVAKDEALAAIGAADSLEVIREVKAAHIGDKSPISRANQQLGGLAPEERATLGKIIGRAKNLVTEALEARTRALEIELPGCSLKSAWMFPSPLGEIRRADYTPSLF